MQPIGTDTLLALAEKYEAGLLTEKEVMQILHRASFTIKGLVKRNRDLAYQLKKQFEDRGNDT